MSRTLELLAAAQLPLALVLVTAVVADAYLKAQGQPAGLSLGATLPLLLAALAGAVGAPRASELAKDRDG